MSNWTEIPRKKFFYVDKVREVVLFFLRNSSQLRKFKPEFLVE